MHVGVLDEKGVGLSECYVFGPVCRRMSVSVVTCDQAYSSPTGHFCHIFGRSCGQSKEIISFIVIF